MADLTPVQLQFLQTHLGYDARNYFSKQILKSQLQEFWRRRDKVNEEIRALPPEHPQIAPLKKAVDTATKKAEQGDIKGAYHDLKAVKETARSAANAVRGGITVGSVNGDLNILETAVRRMITEQRRIREMAGSGAENAIDKARRLPAPLEEKDREKLATLLGENIRDQKALAMEWDGLTTDVTQAIQTYRSMFANAPTIAAQVVAIAHNITLLNKKTPEASKGPHVARYTTLDQQVRSNFLTGKGDELSNEVFHKLRQQRTVFLDVLREKTTPPPMAAIASTDSQGRPLEGAAKEEWENSDWGKKFSEDYAHLEKREQDRLERAKTAYLSALKTDQAYLAMTEEATPVSSSRIKPFDTTDLLDDLDIDVRDTDAVPANIGASAAKGVSERMDELMVGVPVPDEIFEMCSRSKRDWYVEVARSAGIALDPDDPSSVDPKVWANIEAAAEAMHKVAMDKYPDKAKFDKDGKPTEITIGGIVYSDMEKLGSGGFGEVYRATDAKGRSVVVKVPLEKQDDPFDPIPPEEKKKLAEKTHQGLKVEAARHRAVSGGESGECPENILNMKGMVLDPKGMPLIVMDLAGAGDASTYSNAMGAAEKSGLICEGARQAMMAQQMREVVMGMKAMQASGMTHHDLKDLNVFIDDKGTFKVADFGTAEHVDSRGGAVPEVSAFTRGYEAPEIIGEGEVTQKSDNFTLGEMLDRAADPRGGIGRKLESGDDYNPNPHQSMDPEGKVTKVSSMTRMANALKDPDPTKRPSLDAVLMSSYFDDLDKSHTKDDLERLKKATMAYSKSIGKEAAILNHELNTANASIRKLELSKTDALFEERIRKLQLTREQRAGEFRQARKAVELEWDVERRKELEKVVGKIEVTINRIDELILEITADLGKTRSAKDLKDIDEKIERERQKIAQFRKQLDELHKKPENAEILKELEEANKPFR